MKMIMKNINNDKKAEEYEKVKIMVCVKKMKNGGNNENNMKAAIWI